MSLPGFTALHRGGVGTPMVCLHGFTDTWRTWELVLPALERRHEVLAPTLMGHAGGPDFPPGGSAELMVDAIEQAMDDAGWPLADIVGNSLGGYLALQLAARGRARSVVALAPAGGWPVGDRAARSIMDHFTTVDSMVQAAAPHADAIAGTPEGRRQATAAIVANPEHMPADLVANLIRGAAACAVAPLVASALQSGWALDAARVTCPVRVVWGTADRLLPWPDAAARYRHDWLPHADWVVLDDVGHCPQLDVPLETAELILGFADG